MSTGRKLVFIYNADSGVFNLLADAAHKILSPSTYRCNLCALTHGSFGSKTEWRNYLAQLKTPVEVLHADEYRNKYGNENVKLPAILVLKNSSVESFIDADEINICTTLTELKHLIDSRLRI